MFIIRLANKNIKTKMTEQNPSLSQSQSFLPLKSSLNINQHKITPKKQKALKLTRGNSVLYQQLRKTQCDDTDKKREIVIKYLKQQGQMKDTSKIIQKIEEQGHAIPILQVAIALSRYDNQFLKQLLDSKSIELKQRKQSDIYELNKKLQSDPILSLLSDSEQLKKLPKQQKQPSFLDFKQISPKRKNQLIDLEKGRLKKLKIKSHAKVEYPKELKNLKKQLFSLPYINRYKKALSLKNQHKYGRSCQSTNIQPTQISQLNNSNKSFGSFQKNLSKFNQKESLLETSLQKVLQQRAKNVRISTKDISLSKLQPIDNKSLFKQFHNSSDPNRRMLDTIVSKDKSVNQTIKNTQINSLINPEYEDDQLPKNYQRTKTHINQAESSYWPSYKRFSPHNKKYILEMQKLKSKVRSFTELSEIPSQSTLSIYTSLKSLENSDLKKLEKQSLQEQKTFSNTKYKVKYKNFKENYSKRLKQFIKDRKVRQFQLQQQDLQERSNLTTKIIKLNDKMLQKIDLAQNWNT